MGIVLISVLFGKQIPADTRFIIIIITALTASAGSGFIGGYAWARGNISLPFFKTPLSFGVAGGTAVFFLVLLLGHFLYSGNSSNSDIAAIENFNKYKEAYRDKYEMRHLDLDNKIIIKNLDKIKNMNEETYKDFLINELNSLENGNQRIESVANFYESLLQCENKNGVGCSSININIAFGDEIKNFWNTYRLYIQYKRDNGYSKMALLVEKRALLLESQ